MTESEKEPPITSEGELSNDPFDWLPEWMQETHDIDIRLLKSQAFRFVITEFVCEECGEKCKSGKHASYVCSKCRSKKGTKARLNKIQLRRFLNAKNGARPSIDRD